MNTRQHRLWLLLSPALPVGGYSYSQGLEFAVAAGWVSSFAEARAWIAGLAAVVLPHLDLPLLARMARAARAGDRAAMTYWNAYLLASRETAELRMEDLAMGRALQRLLGDLGDGEGSDLLPAQPTFAASFACAGLQWQIGDTELCAAYAWVWSDNQVAAAIKLVPLGQTDGQRLLLELADGLAALTRQALACADEDLGMTATGLAIASAAHETQYTRLFRS